MRKIPTLFVRTDDMRHVTREVSPAAAWVLDGEARATRKYDGTCTMLDTDGRWWARREVKQGKSAPAGYVAEETDPNTGKTVGWEPIEQSPFVKAWREAMNNFYIDKDDLTPGTYELCGPKVNGNPEQFEVHMLIPHGEFTLTDVPLDFDGLATYLADVPYEGIVWHHPDGRMAKIKRRDFPRAANEPNDRKEPQVSAMKTVPQGSDAGLYLTLIAVHGRCQCDLQTGVCLDDLPGCPLCALLDGEWPCPADPEADYPDPDLVTIEGSPESIN